MGKAYEEKRKTDRGTGFRTETAYPDMEAQGVLSVFAAGSGVCGYILLRANVRPADCL